MIESVSKLPLRWSWVHACLSVESKSNHLNLVVNGRNLIDKVFTAAAENLSKPNNLFGKLLLGKAHLWPSLWVKNWGLFANLNIFSDLMSVEQMADMMSSKNCGSAEGDYLAWGSSKWDLFGSVTNSSITPEDLCRTESKIHVFDQNVESQIGCHRLCFNQHKKGRISSVDTREAYDQLVDKQNEIQAVSPEQTWWVSVSGEGGWMDGWKQDGWVDTYSRNPIPDFVWQPGNPKPNEALTCGVLARDNFVANEQCSKTGGRGGFYCPCSFSERPILTLRGLCVDSNIDLLYLPQNNPGTGTITFYGLVRSIGHYKNDQWRIETSFPNTTAATFAPSDTFLMGKQANKRENNENKNKHDWNQVWTIEGDSVRCNNGLSHTRSLKLTGCLDGEFTCDDGQCIKMETRCNQVKITC